MRKKGSQGNRVFIRKNCMLTKIKNDGKQPKLCNLITINQLPTLLLNKKKLCKIKIV